jgi:6-phosphogluconolactonase/glucosamine-6-phosphate isomerase/deaminase
MMSLHIRTTKNIDEAARALSDKIIAKLKEEKKVLWLIPGGSAMPVAVEASKLISGISHKNLTISLTDERYGEVNHQNSNWRELCDLGFNLQEGKQIPVLTGKDAEDTAKDWAEALKKEFEHVNYRIGFFGMGADGHTAGILPGSRAVENKNFTCYYKTPNFERITITPSTIEKLDEVVLWVQGENKWPAFQDLIEKDLTITTQPAQIFKKIPLTVFTDWQHI